MAQILTVASILALVGLLGWRYAARLGNRRPPSGADDRAGDSRPFQRDVRQASAQEFLDAATDITFGLVILGLGFFMLMWVIATA